MDIKSAWVFLLTVYNVLYLQKLPSSYHVIVVDLPGHGDSSIPAADDDVSMSLMLDSLREVRKAIICMSTRKHQSKYRLPVMAFLNKS